MNEPAQRDYAIAIGLIANAIIIAGGLVFLGLQIKQAGAPAAAPAVTQAQAIAPQAPAPPKFDQSKLNNSIAGDYVYGAPNAERTLITYMDFECPYCAAYYPVAKKAVDDSKGKLNLVMRQYPLDFHPHAAYLANVSQCVADQKGAKGFWSFADYAFSGAKVGVDPGKFESDVASRLALDHGRFTQCIAAKPFSDKIQASVNEGTAIGVNGTPATVIYDHDTRRAAFFVGTQQLPQLQAAIDGL